MVKVLILQNQQLNTWIAMYLNSLNQIHGPNSPELNPMDYYIFSRLESMVYAIKITDVVQWSYKSEHRTYWTI